MEQKNPSRWKAAGLWALALLAAPEVDAQLCALDVFVANDQSGSVSALENTQSRQFISSLFNGMQPWGIGPGESRIAIANWDSPGVWQEYSFPVAGPNYTDLLSDVLAYQNAPRTLMGGTDPFFALNSTFQQIGQTPIPGRVSKPIIVLMTDAACVQVPAGIQALATQIKNSGVYIIVVAIEAASTCPSLAGTNVASPGGYFSAPTYADLVQTSVQLVYDIIHTACQNAVSPSYDLQVVVDGYTATGCNTPTPTYTVDYTVTNAGGAEDFTDQLVVSFYDGDPGQPGTQLLAVQNNGVQSIPVGSSFSGTLSSLAFANAATVVAVVNYDGSLPGNAPPISPYLSTGTVAPDEWVTYNNVSNEQDRVSDPVTCPPHAVITTTVSSGGAGCDDLVSYEITVCNTGDADAFVNTTLPITPPGAIQVNNTAVPTTYTNGLVWATYYGGTDGDDGYSVAIDPTGNVYVAGTTQSNAGIATPGAHQTAQGGGRDAFLVKFDTDGNRLWGTYYGGDENDEGMGVTTDAAGNVYLVGHTESTFAIATPGTFQTAWDDGEDAFVVKFNSAGVRQWGTYCGGPDPDFGFSVAVDASGNVYLGGTTEGSTNIASAGAHQTTFGGTMDQFLVKFNATGGRIWGTLYGGSGEDIEADVALDAAGNVYLAGQTQSATAISTAGSHQPVYNGDDDLYLVKFDPAGVRQWGTYYGGLQQETMPCVAVDPLGNVFLGGTTKSPTAIASGALHQPAFGGSRDAFVAKFSSAGVRQWGTYHGGADADEAGDLATDNAGNVYLNGNTMSPTVMSTPGAYQTAIAGLEDAFVAKFSPAGDHGWGTYYGGPDVEDSWGVAVDALGSVYICGTTLSTTGIATAGAHQTVYATQDDAYLAKFNEHEIGSILYAGECVTRQYIYDYSGVGAGTYDLSVGIDADTVALGDDPPVILPDVGFNAGTYVNIDGFNGAAHTSDDVTIPPGGVNCPPGDQLSIAVDIPTASSCGNGNYVQATVTITNTSGLVAFDTELLLGLTGTGATFASEPYGLTAGLVLAAPNLLDPAYPAVPNAIYGLAGSQTLPVPEIPPGTSTFVVDLNVGSTLTNLSAQLDSIHSSFNASGQSNLATDAGGVTVFSDPVINGFTCPGSIVAGNTITLSGISVSGATTVNWSSTSMATLPNSGSVAGPVLVYTPTPMDVANGFVALSLTATNAGGCETTVSCQVLLTNVQYDYGDAPVTYDLNVNYQPPAAASTLFSGMFLGATSPGTELLANNSVMADGDGNEEDGLSANPYTAPWPGPGLPFDPVVTATNTTPKAGHLHGYVDWNADGDFLDTLESSLNTPAVPASSGSQAYVLNFTVPPGVNTAGLFYIRLRLSTDSLAVTIPYMAAPEGETEDYVWNSVGQLPVEMISFTAVPWSDDVMAEWVTASEYNSAWFVLERSASLSGFTPIAQLPAAGMSVTQRNYQYLDQEPLPGTSYYRLRQIDLDGAAEYFGPVAVVRSMHGGIWIEHGLPGELVVHGDHLERWRMLVQDMAGRICSATMDPGGRLDLHELSSGIYVLTVIDDLGHRESHRFVVE